MEKLWTLKRLGGVPDCDTSVTPLAKINRGECDGMPGQLIDEHEWNNPENIFVRFHSDAVHTVNSVVCPVLVVWFQVIEA